MERHSRIHKPGKGLRYIVFSLPVLLLLLLLFIWFGGIHNVGNRMTVVLVGNPVTIVSWNKRDNSFLIVSLPTQAVIESVHGYGKYSLESLWKLGSIEGKEGTVLSESIEELFGAPVPWYIGKKNHMLLTKNDPLTLVKSVFSVPMAPSFFSGLYATNMSPREFLTFVLAFSRRRPDIKILDLEETLVSQALPDGSSELVPDKNSIDQRIGNTFEDSAIRKEGLSVAVFNTTPIASLGTRVSSMLGHTGILVVTVGNDRPTIGACVLRGGKKELASETARFIRELYGCRTEESIEPRADLIFRIGTEYQSRFVPFRTK